MAGQDITTGAAAGQANAGGETLTANQSTQIAAANPGRDQIVISASTADVWLGYGAAAVAEQGIHIPAGESYTETGWKGEIFAISTGAAVVSFMETSYSTVTAAGDDATFTPSGPSDGHPAKDVPTFTVFGQ